MSVELVPGLQLALSEMILLKELLLDSKNIPTDRILGNLVGPFRLSRFSCSDIGSRVLMSFSKAQPTIKEIEFPHHREPVDFCKALDAQPDILPGLCRVSAHPDIVPRLVPGRSVGKIEIPVAFDFERLLDLSSLARSKAPITSICFYNFEDKWVDLKQVIIALKLAGIASAVKQLTVVEILYVSNLVYFSRYPFDQSMSRHATP